MNKKQDTSFEELINKALENAISDRERAVNAYEKLKNIYDIDKSNDETLKGLMLVGQNVSKVLELCQKSNEQIIQLAQIREKDKNKAKKDEKSTPLDIEEIRQIMNESKLEH